MEIHTVEVDASPTAIIRDGMPLGEFAERLMPIFDRVYSTLDEAEIEQGGHNLLVMRGGPEGDVDIEVGILASGPFTEVGDLVASETPGGEAATAVHWGEYDQLPHVHNAVIDWCDDNGRVREGTRWEIYGHWDDDPTKRRTDVFYLLEP